MISLGKKRKRGQKTTKKYVYAVVFDDNKNFLLGLKNCKGYFFHKSNAKIPLDCQNTSIAGKIIHQGQILHGGGNYALPGGRLENENICLEAAREFCEETNEKIPGVGEVHLETFCFAEKFEYTNGNFKAEYYGAYFLVNDISHLKERISKNLEQAKDAENAIKNEEYQNGCYKQLRKDFNKIPVDNELNTIAIWNLETDWEKIENWKDDHDVGWFYEILKYLKDNHSFIVKKLQRI